MVKGTEKIVNRWIEMWESAWEYGDTEFCNEETGEFDYERATDIANESLQNGFYPSADLKEILELPSDFEKYSSFDNFEIIEKAKKNICKSEKIPAEKRNEVYKIFKEESGCNEWEFDNFWDYLIANFDFVGTILGEDFYSDFDWEDFVDTITC